MLDTTTSLAKVEQLFESLPQLISDISQMNDVEIIQTAITARYAEQFAFLVRGACALELRQRVKERLKGGRGKKDNTGEGIKAQMRLLASEIGISEKTLEMDARIKNAFFPEINKTTLEHMPSLAREYYVVALAAPDPQAAIKIANKRCLDPDYKLGDFRAYVRGLKQKQKGTAVGLQAEALSILRVPLSVEVQNILSKLIELSGKRKEDVLKEAILALHRTYSENSSVNSELKSPPNKTEKKAKVIDSNQLSFGI